LFIDSGGGQWSLIGLELLKPLGHPLVMILTGTFIKEAVSIQHINSFEVKSFIITTTDIQLNFIIY
jgi:hypothetical protein